MRPGLNRRHIVRGAAVAVLLAAAAATPLAAQGGSIRGRVTAEQSGQALSGAQVYIPGSGLGTLTNSEGRFLLVNVPAGSRVVRVEMLGYTQQDRSVTVSAGQAATADFAMKQEALSLNALVVTGTAGAAKRREVGNTISQINMAQVATPVSSVDQVLQARAPGLVVQQTSATVGSGARIRLRGNHSANMNNQPLIYVDGVRMMSEGFPKNTFPVGYAGNSDNTSYSPLDDIDPSDIERIEVIKGPAATTLYGTEAAAGVIQIFTKRGAVGQSRWTANITEGLSKTPKFGPTEGLDRKPLVMPSSEVDPYGTPQYMYMDPWLQTGWNQKYDLSVGGGTSGLKYYLSGSYQQTKGTLPDDSLHQYDVRGNFSFSPMQTLQLEWNTGYSHNNVRKTPQGGTAAGLTLNASRRNLNYFQSADPAVIGQVLAFNIHDYIDHLTTGVTATYTPFASMTNRLTVGQDIAQQESREYEPYGFALNPLGQISDQRWTQRNTTFDYVGSWSAQVTKAFNNAFSWGGQAVRKEITSATAASQIFPGPGDPTVSSGAVKLGFEDRMTVVNAGFFFQDVVNLKDRYYLTVGARFDGNSAFGQSLGLQAYPKASLSYILSDEPFWKKAWGTVKLRAAYGQSGRAPGAFDAVRTWNPVSWGSSVSFFPNNLGNADLGPERTTEIEGGFDAAFLNDRLTVSFTDYYDRTTNALFSVQSPASDGGWNSQLQNVGKMQNKGIELQVTGTLIQTAKFGWDVGGSISTNHSKVLDLGGAAPFSLGNFGYVVLGQPVPVMRGICVANPYQVAAPDIQQNCNIGPNAPTKTMDVHTEVRLPHGINVSARGEYEGGNYAYGLLSGEGLTRGIDWPSCWNAYPAIKAGNASSLPAIEQAMCQPVNMTRSFAIYPLDFFKVRDVTVDAPLPVRFPGAESVRLTLSGQNLYTWRKAKWTFIDPETNGGFSGDNSLGQNATVWQVEGSLPIPMSFVLSLHVVF
jgi:TonB-dependent starch-binding outer membrane protein SusC